MENKMTLREYLGTYASPFGYDVSMFKGRMKTKRAQERWDKFKNEKAQSYYKERDRLIAEYKSKFGDDRVNNEKELIITANGNPDNESVLAARRVCEKRGINYKVAL